MKWMKQSDGILKRKVNVILLLSLLAISSAAVAQIAFVPRFATVRGMLEDRTGKTPVPAVGVMVTLENQNYTLPAVRSGKDGLYYISNVPPGTYTLKVWTNPKSPLSFTVKVTGPLTDIPPVIVAPTLIVNGKLPLIKHKMSIVNKAAQAPATH